MLLLRDRGSFARIPTYSQRFAIAGAVLMELAGADRVDADPKHLILVDGTPTSDELLDPTLAEIAAGERQNTRYWIEHIAERADVIRAGALGRLIGKGILTERDRRVLWVFHTRRYPSVDGHACQAVRLRLAKVLRSNDVPGRRDVFLICLADTCGILRTLLSRRELRRLSPRIRRTAGRDLISRNMVRANREVRGAVVSITNPT